jgi:hypothetical protein
VSTGQLKEYHAKWGNLGEELRSEGRRFQPLNHSFNQENNHDVVHLVLMDNLLGEQYVGR